MTLYIDLFDCRKKILNCPYSRKMIEYRKTSETIVEQEKV